MIIIKKINIKDYSIIIILSCVIFLYLFFIKPVGLYDIISNGTIRSAFVTVIFNDLQEHEVDKIPNQYSFRLEKEDYDEYIEILNKYEYSKDPIYYFDTLRPAEFGYRIIDCTINYNEDNISHNQVTVNSDNEVRFNNKNGVYRNYKVHSQENLFEDLFSWLNEKYNINR